VAASGADRVTLATFVVLAVLVVLPVFVVLAARAALVPALPNMTAAAAVSITLRVRRPIAFPFPVVPDACAGVLEPVTLEPTDPPK
jgi:hypothetical protein